MRCKEAWPAGRGCVAQRGAHLQVREAADVDLQSRLLRLRQHRAAQLALGQQHSIVEIGRHHAHGVGERRRVLQRVAAAIAGSHWLGVVVERLDSRRQRHVDRWLRERGCRRLDRVRARQ